MNDGSIPMLSALIQQEIRSITPSSDGLADIIISVGTEQAPMERKSGKRASRRNSSSLAMRPKGTSTVGGAALASAFVKAGTLASSIKPVIQDSSKERTRNPRKIRFDPDLSSNQSKTYDDKERQQLKAIAARTLLRDYTAELRRSANRLIASLFYFHLESINRPQTNDNTQEAPYELQCHGASQLYFMLACSSIKVLY